MIAFPVSRLQPGQPQWRDDPIVRVDGTGRSPSGTRTSATGCASVLASSGSSHDARATGTGVLILAWRRRSRDLASHASPVGRCWLTPYAVTTAALLLRMGGGSDAALSVGAAMPSEKITAPTETN